MIDPDRLDATFRLALGLPDDVDVAGAAYDRTEGWDSVGHMELMVGLEAAFGISIDADDVFAMSDYAAVREILRDRYAIQLPDR
jgi:acyl carrier protein